MAKKYNVDNPSKAQEIKDKKKNTCQLHFNCDCPLQSAEVREKSIKTWQKNYGEGIINPGQAQTVKDNIKATWKNNYGEDIENPFQVESVKEKSKQTWLKNHGVDNPFKSSVIQDKAKATWQKNYGEGIINPFQSDEVKRKTAETLKEKYGENIVNVSQVEEIQDKIKSTCEERYGSENYFSSDDFKNKTRDTWSFNGYEGPCSRQQKYIANLVNGKINEAIAGYWADIYIEKENIVIEYDGSGHFLNDIMNGNTFPTKESILREKEREDKIINNGYRMIRFIATKDRIPSDEVILNLIEGFKNSDFKVIRINFEEGTIDRDYEERWYCNFGELRKITQKDLEQFEK